MMEIATLTWGDESFWFVSDDGDHFYEVAPRPERSEDVEHLRPLGGPTKTEGTREFYRMSFARAFLQRMNYDPEKTVEFEEVQ